MLVALALVLAVVVLAACILGIFWALVCLVPFYAYVALAVFLVWRARRREAEFRASVMQDVERQRLYNEQEMRAWDWSLKMDRRNAAKREKALRDFDRSREPPKT